MMTRRLGIFLWILVGCSLIAGILCVLLGAIEIVDEIALLAAMLSASAYACTGLPSRKR